MKAFLVWCCDYPLPAVFLLAIAVGLVLVALRVLGVIAWPWWLVWSPVAIPIALAFFAVLAFFDDVTRNGWH